MDRFGRIVDQRWAKGASDLDRVQHTYDRNSNRLTRDVTATGAPTTLDEAYTYDGLDRLTKVNRGALASGTITDASATYTRNWNLDALGNWPSLVTDADGGGAGAPTSQTRTHDARNRITTLAGASLTHDANGNLTSDGSTGKTYTYDAWNRLAKVTAGGLTIAVYEYDALGRQAQSGVTTPTDKRWFSLRWQVLETRPADGKTTQQVWSPVYVDAMVCRDRDTDANGSLDERVYPLHDANFDVTALVDTSGTVVERFIYDRYGGFAVLDANWANDADGLSDVAWGNYYQGHPYDAPAGGTVARNRIPLHYLGRPLQADPTGYADGMSPYEWERSNPTGLLDPLGLTPTLGGFGGINNPEENYVAEWLRELRGMDGQQLYDPSAQFEDFHSALTFPGDISALDSSADLDDEARRLAREFVRLHGRASFCRPGQRTTIRVLMIAPKTQTLPPDSRRIRSCCCDFHIDVLLGVNDIVPNQSPLAPNDAGHWAQWGTVTPVRIVGKAGHTPRNHLGGPFDVMRLQTRPTTDPLQRARGVRHPPVLRRAGSFDPQRWLRDNMRPEQDGYTFVCHSQGCNILMHLLGMGCLGLP